MTREWMFGTFGRNTRTTVAAIGLVIAAAAMRAGAEPLVIDFEAETPRNPELAGAYWDPSPGFAAAGAVFSGGTYEGFVVSSSTTTNQAGYLYFGSEAEISAQSNGGAGGGVGGSTNFAVVYNGGSFITLPEGYKPGSVYLTNTATAYEAILNGLFQATAFVAGDWFRVTFTGYSLEAGGGSQTGIPVDFYLADYREGQSLIVGSWTPVDLTPLGEARSIVMSFSSTDNDPEIDPPFNMNTPAYVAMDDMTLIPVPEPASLALALAGLVMLGQRLRRHRCRGTIA